MALREQIQADLKNAMKQRDAVRVTTLRLLLAQVQNRTIAKGDVLDDTEVGDVLTLAVKQRRESIALAQQYHREDIANQEQRELGVLETYLPEPLGVEELAQHIDAVVRELGVTSPKDLGRVMQALMPTVKGRVDGQTVNRLVRARLATSLAE